MAKPKIKDVIFNTDYKNVIAEISATKTLMFQSTDLDSLADPFSPVNKIAEAQKDGIAFGNPIVLNTPVIVETVFSPNEDEQALGQKMLQTITPINMTDDSLLDTEIDVRRKFPLTEILKPIITASTGNGTTASVKYKTQNVDAVNTVRLLLWNDSTGSTKETLKVVENSTNGNKSETVDLVKADGVYIVEVEYRDSFTGVQSLNVNVTVTNP